MGEYTLVTLLGMASIVALEWWWRTGIFGTLRYWCSMAIVLGFQVLVDGWLTRLDRPTVVYDEGQFSGVRWPFDIPIEDFGFGWWMTTLAILVWCRARDRHEEIA